MSTTTFDNMIGKVRGLLNKADDPATTPQEAESYRDKAESLIFKYKLDMASAPEEERKVFMPSWRQYDLHQSGSPFSAYYGALFRELVRHVDARMTVYYERKEFGSPMDSDYRVETWAVADVCGYESDLEFVALLWESTRLAFGKRIEPKYDPKLSEAMNAFNLRMGGMERHRIATALFGKLEDGEETTWVLGKGHQPSNKAKARNRKVTKLIEEGAKAAGQDPSIVLGRGNNIKTFRDSYVSGFYQTLVSRLRNMALSRGETDKGLVLASLAQRVETAFFTKYPELKPQPRTNTGRDAYIAPNENCERCKKTKSGYCREHQYLKPSAARYRGPAVNTTAYSAGSAAARTVDLGRGGTPKAGSAAPRKEL